LAAKKRKEVKAKAKAKHVAVKQMGEQAKEEENGSDKSQKSPSPEVEEEDEQMEQGGMDPKMTPLPTKHNRDPEKVGPWKKSKASKTSLDPITLMEGPLNDIGDKVKDATVKLLQQFKQQHQQALGVIEMILCELQIHTS